MYNPMSDSDRAFLRQFSIVIVLLTIIAVLLGGVAWAIYSGIPQEHNPDMPKQTQARLAPVGGVYAGDTGRAAMQAAQAAAAKAAADKVAYGGTTDGKTIYGKLCTTCHTTGVAGAPKLGSKSAWGPRIAQGIDTLVKHAMNGYTGPDGNHMPAKGGNPALTRQQITNTVKWMVKQAQ